MHKKSSGGMFENVHVVVSAWWGTSMLQVLLLVDMCSFSMSEVHRNYFKPEVFLTTSLNNKNSNKEASTCPSRRRPSGRGLRSHVQDPSEGVRPQLGRDPSCQAPLPPSSPPIPRIILYRTAVWLKDPFHFSGHITLKKKKTLKYLV